MAPQKGGQATKQQQQHKQQTAGNGKRAGVAAGAAARPAVVPAIPLPLMQRQSSARGSKHQQQQQQQQQQQSAPLVVSSTPSTAGNDHPVASLEAALIVQQQVAADDSAAMAARRGNSTKSDLNGSRVEKPEPAADSNSANKPDTRELLNDLTHPLANGNVDGSVQIRGNPPAATRALANGFADGIAKITFGDSGHEHTAPSSSSTHVSTAPSVVGDAESGISNASSTSFQESTVKQDAYVDVSTAQVSQPKSVTAPAEAVYAPQFYTRPSVHERHMLSGPNSAGLYPPQHMRPNGADIVFGGLGTPDSHTPSPAPSAFMPPPPPRHMMNGINVNSHGYAPANGHRMPHNPSEGNGNNFAAPITPYRSGPPNITMDSYSLPLTNGPVSRTIDGYLSNGTHYEPPTPRSVHGSHASADFNGIDNPIPFSPNGHLERDPRGDRSRGPVGPNSSHRFIPRSDGMEEFVDSINYFQKQFNSSQLSDCTFELRVAEGCGPPAKINAHKLILARSPALHQHIMVARAADPGSHDFIMTATDQYLRADAWIEAVRHLYLFPLLTPPVYNTEYNVDQFRFSAGYAAAGHMLDLHDVLMRGIHLASSMLNWHTIEEALAFALEGATQRHYVNDNGNDGFTIEFAYGPEISILMREVTCFLIDRFPSNFKLDTTVSGLLSYGRIPAPAVVDSPSKTSPAIARGTSIRKTANVGRTPAIQFGDLPSALPEEDASAAPVEPAKCSAQLSRILLNLPFEDLRYVLSTEIHGPAAWNTASHRYDALRGVIAEREARRLRAVEAVRAGAVPGFKEVQQRLSSQRRHDIVDPWDLLNWQEMVVQRTGGVHQIARTWVPQFDVPAEPDVELPQYDAHPHESMV